MGVGGGGGCGGQGGGGGVRGLFYIIGGTAEEYLTPALNKISKFLNMSENLAGVTLLALGNGSPDVISCFTASRKKGTGIYMAASGLVGSCLVNSFFLAPVVILISKTQVRLPIKSYSINVIFLIITTSLVTLFFAIGTIYWYMALILPVIYILYVTICILMEVSMKKDTENRLIKEKSN